MRLDERDLFFKRVGKLYVAEWDSVGRVESYVTSQETDLPCTKAEVLRAKQAYQLISASGYPSVNEVIGLIEDGNISGLPGITRADIRRAYELYGPLPAYVRGKMTSKKVSRV